MLNRAFVVAKALTFPCVPEVVTITEGESPFPIGPIGKKIMAKRPSTLPKGSLVGIIIIEVSHLEKMAIGNIVDIPTDFKDLIPCEPSVAWNFVQQLVEAGTASSDTYVFPSDPVDEHILLIGPDSTGKIWVDGCYADIPGILPDHYKLVFQVA